MKNFKKLLNKEFESLIPAQSERLKNTPIVSVEQEEKPKKKFSLWKTVVSFSCVLVFAVISVFAVNFASKPTDKVKAENYSSYITLSVNPSFSLLTDENGKVEKVVAENYDGEIVLMEVNYAEKHYDVVIQDILKKCADMGYMASSQRINVSITCKDEKVYSTIQKKVKEVASSLSGDNNLNVEQKDTSYIKAIAQKYSDLITEDSDFDDVLEALKGKKSFFEWKREDEGENSEKTVDLMILKVVFGVAEEQMECFEEIDELMEKNGWDDITKVMSAFMSEDAKEIVELLGELNEICFESDYLSLINNYKDLKEKYSFGCDGEVLEQMAELAEECLEEFDQSSYEEILEFLNSYEKLKSLFDEVKELLNDTLSMQDLLKKEVAKNIFKHNKTEKKDFTRLVP